MFLDATIGQIVYHGLALQTTDQSSSLQPYTTYQYMIIVYNTEGQTNSLWTSVLTKEAPPTGVLSPMIIVCY